MTRITRIAAAATVALLAAAGSAQAAVDRDATYQVARLTGPGSINATDLGYNVYGTDLGSIFEHEGRLYMAFGDTFGAPGKPPAFGGDWRSSVMAYTRDRHPEDGLTFDGMIADRPGHAKELISDDDVPGTEITTIPTNGISVGHRMYLHYMAVREWGPPGQWWLNRSGLAYSDDDGQNWTVSTAAWPGDSNFGQVAFVRAGDRVYLLGIPGGRFGHVELARVDKHRLLDLDRYEYWADGAWTPDRDAASTLVPGPVGELSVQWNSYYRKWLMTYLDEGRAAVVLRTADCLTGPWTDEETLVTAQDAPQLYAPFLPPRFDDGPDIWFTLSRFNYYDVFWWHTALTDVPKGTAPARCIDRDAGA